MKNINYKYKNKKRLESMIINNVCNDQLDELKINLGYYLPFGKLKDSFKYDLIHNALTHLSPKCSNYLIKELDVKIPNMIHIFSACKWNKLYESYFFLKEISEDLHNYYMFVNFKVEKYDIIKRLLDPSRVEFNPLRVNYIFELVNKGFIDLPEVRKVINETYVQETKKAPVIALLRELNLRELGIE
jgi:hypothetical protein